MKIEMFVLPKNYSFTFLNNKTGKYRRLTSDHGLINLLGKLIFHYEFHAIGGEKAGGFNDAWSDLVKAGWNQNYSKADLKQIYADVLETVSFIEKNEFSNTNFLRLT